MDGPSKFCSRCLETKLLETEWGKNRAKADGYQQYCKACRRELHAEKYHVVCKKYRRKNSVRIAERHRKYYRRNRKRILARVEIYRLSHLEKYREKNRRYYERHRQAILSRKRKARQ